MHKSKTLWVAAGACCLLVLTAIAWWTMRDRTVAEAMSLQQQLTNVPALSPQLQKQLSQNLVRLVDRMDRVQFQELTEQVRAARRNAFEINMTEFLDSPPENRDEVLDRHLVAAQKWTKLYAAMRTDAFIRVRGNRGNRGSGRDRQRTNRERDDNRRQSEATPERKAAAQAEREQFATYWRALRDRAQETGVDLGRGGRRRRS